MVSLSGVETPGIKTTKDAENFLFDLAEEYADDDQSANTNHAHWRDTYRDDR